MNALVADITNAQNEGGELLGTTLPDETASLKENRLYPIDSRGNGFYYTLQGIRTTTPINGIYIQILKYLIILTYDRKTTNCSRVGEWSR